MRRRWYRDTETLLAALRASFAYGPGENRAAGYLYSADQDWPEPLAAAGWEVLGRLGRLLEVSFTIAAFQAYRDGAGCTWHADLPFGAQAVLSLGVTRTLGLRRPGEPPQMWQLADGDLAYMPPGFQREWEHCVPEEDVPGERCSLVFRTPAP